MGAGAGSGDPVDLLEEQAASRVPELVPIRYGRMLVSPFTFFRGAAYPMAADLAATPRTGLEVQLCGDAHLSNFGAFAAPDRRLIFCINDFDETLPGPFEWDVKRLVASFAVAGRDRGFDAKQRETVNRTVTRCVSGVDPRVRRDDELRRSGTRASTSMRSRAPPAEQASRKQRSAVRAQHRQGAFEGQHEGLRQADDDRRRRAADRRRPAAHRPDRGHGRRARAGDIEALVHGAIRSYRRTLSPDRRRLLERYRYVHAARKVVGVGSVGTRAWIVLMLGRDDSDPLFLQLKEAQASVLEPFLGKSAFAQHGQRVVEGQRLMQAASDIMLGWIRLGGADGEQRDFYMRQLWDGKGSALVETMSPTDDGPLRAALWPRAREGPRPFGRRDRDRRLSGRRRQLRPRAGRVRGDLRRPERARLRRAGASRVVRAASWPRPGY